VEAEAADCDEGLVLVDAVGAPPEADCDEGPVLLVAPDAPLDALVAEALAGSSMRAGPMRRSGGWRGGSVESDPPEGVTMAPDWPAAEKLRQIGEPF
jgi:hypothetical protein